VPEPTLNWFVGNTAATNNVPRNSNFVHGTTPVRPDNAAILNYWRAISKPSEKERWAQASAILACQRDLASPRQSASRRKRAQTGAARTRA
jgi:hypothetical protein